MVESSQNRLTEKRSKKNSKSPAKYNTKSTNQGSIKKESQTSSERPRALPPQKPHVGKRIHVYRNGDIYYAGINVSHLIVLLVHKMDKLIIDCKINCPK